MEEGFRLMTRYWLFWFYSMSILSAGDGFSAAEDQRRLVKDLFQDYNKLVRPGEGGHKTIVNFVINLAVIIYVDDRHQVMKINGYLNLEWNDPRLIFDESQYGGNLSTLRLPSGKVWEPEIALVTTTDGQYGPSYRCNVLIQPKGIVQWMPPFISKSSCDLNPRFFPFDEQICTMKFRSLMYNSEELQIDITEEVFVIKDYLNQSSGTWDLIGAPVYAYHNVSISGVQRDFVECRLRLRRKSLFYVVTILLPCILISFLTGFVFLLPSKGKTNVCLSILFAIVVFLLLMSNILSPANVLPLLSEFLFFTFIMNVLSTFFTVVAININFRSSNTYTMPRIFRVLFLQFLPVMLFMKRPVRHIPKPRIRRNDTNQMNNQNADSYLYQNPQCITPMISLQNEEQHDPIVDNSSMHGKRRPGSPILALRLTPLMNKRLPKTSSPVIISQRSIESAILRESQMFTDLLADMPGYHQALKAVAYIAHNMERKTDREEISDDWRFMSQVIDRLLLWVFFIVTSAGSLGIILNSPYLFDSVVPMQESK